MYARTLPGSLTVGDEGSANYELPLWLPDGPNAVPLSSSAVGLTLTCADCHRANSDLSPRCEHCGRSLPAISETGDAPDPREGTRLGRFRVVKRLGAGGMGVVYEALDGDEAVAKPGIDRAKIRCRDAFDQLRRLDDSSDFCRGALLNRAGR